MHAYNIQLMIYGFFLISMGSRCPLALKELEMPIEDNTQQADRIPSPWPLKLETEPEYSKLLTSRPMIDWLSLVRLPYLFNLFTRCD